MDNKVEITNASGKKYEYAFEDISITQPFFDKYFVQPILKILPASLKSNTITLISGIFAFSAFALIIQARKNVYHAWFLVPFFFLGYIVCDYLDGAQARKIGCGSPLGEFLDHFFDSLATGYLVSGLLVAYHVESKFFFILSLALGYFAQATAFWEKYRNKKMYFAKFSATESIILIGGVITLAGITPLRNFMEYEFLFGINCVKLFIVFCAVCTGISSVTALIRSGGASIKFYSYAISSFVVALFISQTNFPLYVKCVIVSLYCVSYLSKLLTSITMDVKDKYPDFIFPLLAFLIMIFNEHIYIRILICLIYLIFSVMMKVFNLFFLYVNKWTREKQ